MSSSTPVVVSPGPGKLRRCGDRDRNTILTLINAAAIAYRGVIPADCWHEPYMSQAELDAEVQAGVEFWGREAEDRLIGVMGIQSVRGVDLIRHAYVRPDMQGKGVGADLITYLRQLSNRRMLVGTWADATWAIRFYQHHDFQLAEADKAASLLQTYWKITARQAETSVVLANPAFDTDPSS